MDEINILSAIRQIAAERKLNADVIIEAIKEAVKAGYKSAYELDERDLISVEIDAEAGLIIVYIKKDVVSKVADDRFEISLKEAQKIDKSLSVGDTVLIDITAEGDFGRIAAQTARQVILQHLRETEKEVAIEEVKKKIGSIELVTIQRVFPNGDILCEINKARAMLKKEDRTASEYYPLGSRLKVILMSIEEDERGKYLRVSRSAPEFLEALFTQEVPEIESGSVEIVNIAREEGFRSKVSVKSNTEGIDPTGSCIGQKGVRINAIMNELKLGKIEEKIDIIPWNSDISTYISNAIRPADAKKVVIKNEKKKIAEVFVNQDQLSLAIGKEGQNSRLAEKLTGWSIEIVPFDQVETTEDTEEAE